MKPRSRNIRYHRHHSLGYVWLEFLGSMNVAITILAAVAIASLIGVLVPQNASPSAYNTQYGEFWSAIFQFLQLGNIFHAWWFLLLLGFLVISTSVCVVRNTPNMLRDMVHFRLNAQQKSLQNFHHREEWQLATHGSLTELSQIESAAQRFLRSRGYRMRKKVHQDHIVLAGMKGAWARLGYVFTHVAVVLIGVGGLLDANWPLRYLLWTGQVQVAQQDQAPIQPDVTHQIPAYALQSFLGTAVIAPQQRLDTITIPVADGFLMYKLPFSMEVSDVRTEYTGAGELKRAQCKLKIHTPATKKPRVFSLASDQPLRRSSFSFYLRAVRDGGSYLQIQAWPLLGEQAEPKSIQGRINGFTDIHYHVDKYRFSFFDFQEHALVPALAGPGPKSQTARSPSIRFSVSNQHDVVYEYINFLDPVQIQGRAFFLTGVRRSPAEPYRYMHIPVDSRGSLDLFMKYRARLYDTDRLRQATQQIAQTRIDTSKFPDREQRRKVVLLLQKVVDDFTAGGLDTVVSRLREVVPAQQVQDVSERYVRMLREVLASVYLDLLKDEGVVADQSQTDAWYMVFFEDSFKAMSVLPLYESPYFLQVQDFQRVEAMQVQVSRSTGKPWVYFGCILLITGVLVMFYVSHRRVWVYLTPMKGGVRLLFAGSGHRSSLAYDREFERLLDGLKTSLTARD